MTFPVFTIARQHKPVGYCIYCTAPPFRRGVHPTKNSTSNYFAIFFEYKV